MPPQLLGVLASVSALLLLVGLWYVTRPATLQRRLSPLAVAPRSLEELELQQPFGSRVVRPIMNSMANLVTRFAPQSYVDGLRHKLVLAGNPKGWEARDFLAVVAFASLVLGALGILVGARVSNPAAGLLFSVLGFAIGAYLPNVWLRGKVGSRRKSIQRALPDALDLLRISVEAGMGFDQAIQKLVSKWDNALTVEFHQTLSEMRVGKSRREALRDMADRCDVNDVNVFVSALVQADQLGVSIARVLSVQVEEMRFRRRQRAQESAQKAPIKMIFAMVLLIFPALYVVIIGPAMPALIKSFS